MLLLQVQRCLVFNAILLGFCPYLIVFATEEVKFAALNLAPIGEHGGPDFAACQMLALFEVVVPIASLVVVHKNKLPNEGVVEVSLAHHGIGAE